MILVIAEKLLETLEGDLEAGGGRSVSLAFAWRGRDSNLEARRLFLQVPALVVVPVKANPERPACNRDELTLNFDRSGCTIVSEAKAPQTLSGVFISVNDVDIDIIDYRVPDLPRDIAAEADTSTIASLGGGRGRRILCMGNATGADQSH